MIHINGFTGEYPRTKPHLLPDGAAQEAHDCDFTANVLTGLNGFSGRLNTTLTSIRSVFAYSNSDSGDLQAKVYAWQTDADVVRGPIANDAYDRMYWVAAPDYRLKVTRDSLVGADPQPDPLKTYWLGVPAPTAAPNCGGDGMLYGASRLTDVVAICETPSGTVVSSESIMALGNKVQDDVSGLSYSFAYAPKCNIGSASASSALTLPSGYAWVGTEQVYASATATSQQVYDYLTGVKYYTSYVMGGASVAMSKYSHNGQQYVHYSDWSFAPIGSVVYAPVSGTVDYTAMFNEPTTGWDLLTTKTISTNTGVVTYYSIGSGWYCTDPNAAAPTGSSNGQTSFAVRLFFGSTFVTLRESSSLSAFGMSGYVGEFVYGNGVLVANMRLTTASTTMVEQRSYVATYVNIFGEEGPPSPVAEVSVPEGHSIDVVVAGLGATNYAPIAKIRLYRSATGTDTSSFLFHSEVDNASSVTISDYLLASALGEPISTLNYFPPEEGLRGLKSLPNGILYAFKNNEIHFSEPYLPYAWNPANIITTQDTIIGSCPADSGFYVTTRSNPYFISGLTPDAMSQMKMTAIQAGVSKGSICNIGPAVVYASNDGLVTAVGGQASLDWSFKFFTRNEWRDRYGTRLDRLRLNAHDGHLVAWFEDGTPGFLMRFDEVEPSFTRLDRGIYAACTHPKDDELYVCLDGANLYAFKHYQAPRMGFSWWSKDYVAPFPLGFAAAQVIGTGEVTIEHFADDVLVQSETVAMTRTGTIYRTTAERGRRWSFRLTGTGEVEEFNIAASIQELKSV